MILIVRERRLLGFVPVEIRVGAGVQLPGRILIRRARARNKRVRMVRHAGVSGRDLALKRHPLRVHKEDQIETPQEGSGGEYLIDLSRVNQTLFRAAGWGAASV